MLLDHGLIVEIPDMLRQQYCQLWCSFILDDQVAAKAIATNIAGEPYQTRRKPIGTTCTDACH